MPILLVGGVKSVPENCPSGLAVWGQLAILVGERDSKLSYQTSGCVITTPVRATVEKHRSQDLMIGEGTQLGSQGRLP